MARPGVRAFGKAPGRIAYILEAIAQGRSYSTDKVSAHAMSGVLGWTASNAAFQRRRQLCVGDKATMDYARNFSITSARAPKQSSLSRHGGPVRVEETEAGLDFVADLQRVSISPPCRTRCMDPAEVPWYSTERPPARTSARESTLSHSISGPRSGRPEAAISMPAGSSSSPSMGPATPPNITGS